VDRRKSGLLPEYRDEEDFVEDGLDEEDDYYKDNEDEFSIEIDDRNSIMANLNNLLIGMFFGTLAQISTFYQLQVHLSLSIKNNYGNCINGYSNFNVIFIFCKKSNYSI
jgi:hypothetical protein